VKGLRTWWGWLSDDARHRTGVRIAQVAIGLMIWFRVATEFRYAGYFWGPHGIGNGSPVAIFGHWLGSRLGVAFHTETGTRLVLLALAASAIGLIAGKATRAATGAALVLSWMLEERLPELLDGGDNITRIVLVYMCFLLPGSAPARKGDLRTFVHNVAVLAIAAQLCVLYVTAGLMKAGGPRWTQGTALYLISQVDWFSLPGTRWLFRNPVVTTLATYGTVFFQLWFPMAILSRLKPLWLVLGVGLHLSIGFQMGLIPFSTVMIGLELFLVNDQEWSAVRAWKERLAARMSARMGRFRLEPEGEGGGG
jgi:hypothetical protein